MRIKVLFAVVMGLLAAVLVPVSSQIRGSSPAVSPAQLAAAARTPQPSASAAVLGEDGAIKQGGVRWHRKHQHLPRPGEGGQAPSPSASPSASPTAAPPAQPLNCALVVPHDPLSARGLATPWELTEDGAGPCHESDPNVSAFVEAAVVDPATGQVSTYDPLVVDRETRPAIVPTLPTLPAGAVVGIWVGYNGNSLTLKGPGSDSCVTGIDDSIFGQNSFCNATPFFAAANQAIKAGKLIVPALGTARDGKPCPTSRDFSVVDQDQSDNTTTKYLVTARGQIAQNTPANLAKLTGAVVATNGSDEGLLDRAIDTALGCTPWTVPNLDDPTHQQLTTSWPLNELMASARQAPPVALVPANDPFVVDGTNPSLSKLNAYRAGVDQPAVSSLAQASTKTYCQNLLSAGLPRIAADQQFTGAAASPFPGNADSLFDFLALRFNQTFSNGDGFLHCEQLLNVQNPITLQTNAAGVVTGATIDLHPGPAKR